MRHTGLMVRRAAAMVIAWAGLAGIASAYYPFLRYATSAAPYKPIPEKFDLSALTDNTLYFFVSDQGPDKMVPGDSLASLLSQLRLAGETWNAVDTSALRVAFGGLFSAGKTPQSTPHVEIIFSDDVPPGVLAEAGPTSLAAGPNLLADVKTGPNGSFVPITTSTVIFRSDFSQQPTYLAPFLLTAVHEMGHALGLQHSFASGAMSTEVTRATTRVNPLAADDVAGLSWLYPAPKFALEFGSISGQVTMSGSGVHMASVVALTPIGEAVSALTAPDGTYEIDGVPPGQYYVYVHPLPPATEGTGLGPGDIVLPLGPDGKSIPTGGSFGTLFYPATPDVRQAVIVPVKAGAAATGVNFSVQPRGTPEIYGVTTYGYFGSIALKPAFLSIDDVSESVLVASGTGLVANGAPVPGLNVSAIGSSAVVPPGGVTAYDSFLEVSFRFTPFSGVGPRHLVFSLPDDIYVLPSGLNLVNQQPPQITVVKADFDANGNRIVDIIGSDFTADTRIMFDGLLATVNSVDQAHGRIVVTPPPGASGYTANVFALNDDGQTSMFWTDTPPTYTYDQSAAPSVLLSQAALPASTEAMIDISGVNTQFTDGQTSIGFGSSDIVVKRLWVMSPTHMRADVVVSGPTAVKNTLVSIVSGFEIIPQPLAFTIQSANPAAVVLDSDVVNQATGQLYVYPGIAAVVNVTNLPQVANLTLTLNGVPVQILGVARNQITFQVPANISPGPAVFQLQAGGATVFPVIVSIGAPPPVVTSVLVDQLAVSATNMAHPGDLITIIISGLTNSAMPVDANRLDVNVGGIDHQPVGPAIEVAGQTNQDMLQVVLSPSLPVGPQVPLTVAIDGRTSVPYLIPIHSP